MCGSANSIYKTTTPLVEGLEVAALNKDTAAATDECLKTTELFTKLSPDSVRERRTLDNCVNS